MIYNTRCPLNVRKNKPKIHWAKKISHISNKVTFEIDMQFFSAFTFSTFLRIKVY